METARTRKEREVLEISGELKVGVEGVNEVDELLKLLVRARGSADTVIDVTEEEVGFRASVASEEGLFHVSYEEAGIAWVHAGTHGHPCQLLEGFSV
eukprot:g15243.t1